MPVGVTEPTEQQLKIAEAVVNGGKSFRAAALENGLSKSYARLGEKNARRTSRSLESAFRAVVANATYEAKQLKAMAINRLVENVQSGKDLSTRSVELLGRLKEVDMFVRPADQNIGLFVNLSGTEQMPEWKEHITQEALSEASDPLKTDAG